MSADETRFAMVPRCPDCDAPLTAQPEGRAWRCEPCGRDLFSAMVPLSEPVAAIFITQGSGPKTPEAALAATGHDGDCLSRANRGLDCRHSCSARMPLPIQRGDTSPCDVRTPHERHLWEPETHPVVCLGGGGADLCECGCSLGAHVVRRGECAAHGCDAPRGVTSPDHPDCREEWKL